MLRIIKPVGKRSGVECGPPVGDIQIRVFKSKINDKNRQQAEYVHDQILREQYPQNIAGNQDRMICHGADQRAFPDAFPKTE